MEKVFGLHSVRALLKTAPHRVRRVHVANSRRDEKMQRILQTLKGLNVEIEFCERKRLDSLVEGNHQGIVIFAEPGIQYAESDLDALVQNTQGDPLILVLDGVTDPHNLGACLRTADAAGVHALVVPKDNSASLNEVARKIASGAADTVPLIAVTNLARCLKKLQSQGLWITGLAGEAEQTLDELDLSGPRVIVMGAEGQGMRRLTREHCDQLAKIPMQGSVSSLNVSVATGITLFEVVRQRRQHLRSH